MTEPEPTGDRCFFCPGVAHEATGCRYSPTVLACRSCTETFWAWHRGRQHTVFRRVNPETGKPAKKGEPGAKTLYFYDDKPGPAEADPGPQIRTSTQ